MLRSVIKSITTTTTINGKCRHCYQFDETVEQLVSASPLLAKEQYIKRRDRVCAQLHCSICKDRGVKLENERWYDHVPKLVETSCEGKITILGNQQVQIDRTVRNNKLDIIICDNVNRTCVLIDFAILGTECD